jgi:transcriptional regulator with PAS, ATPase and Fis domain
MTEHEWVNEFPGAITVCDPAGTILEMNDRSAEVFASDGGRALIGSNVLDCHPEPSRTQLRGMLASGKPNIYTIEKAGQKKLIYQAPWYRQGVYAGFVEFGLEIPVEMPHFVRG